MTENSKRFNFTKAELNKVTCPPSGRDKKNGQVFVYDTRVPCLALRVTENGDKCFVFAGTVRGKYKRIVLGKLANSTIEIARRKALDHAHAVTEGRDPRAETLARNNEPTVGDLWQSYLDGHARQHKRTSSVKSDEQLYHQHLEAWAARGIKEITAADVDTLKVRIGKNSPTNANRVMALLSCMYRKRGHLLGLPRHYSPVTGIDRYQERARDRVLTAQELGALLAAVKADPNETIRDYFLMALYTGARRSNVAGMRWEDVSLERATWKIPGEKTKNGNPMVIDLVTEAVALLKERPDGSPYVFPVKRVTAEQLEVALRLRDDGMSSRHISREMAISQTQVCRMLAPGFKVGGPAPFNGQSKAWKRILKRAGIKERTTIHDLRRTFCTALLEAGGQLPTIAAAMGHKSMSTTQKHYAIARQDKVRDLVNAGVTGMLADAEKASPASAAEVKTPAA